MMFPDTFMTNLSECRIKTRLTYYATKKTRCISVLNLTFPVSDTSIGALSLPFFLACTMYKSLLNADLTAMACSCVLVSSGAWHILIFLLKEGQAPLKLSSLFVHPYTRYLLFLPTSLVIEPNWQLLDFNLYSNILDCSSINQINSKESNIQTQHSDRE